MNAMMKSESTAMATAEHVASVRTALKTSLYPGASDDSVDMVLSYCSAAGLDPITKPVHIVPMWDRNAGRMRDVVMPGIGLYRTIAARTGCAGISEPDFGPDVQTTIGGASITYPEWCRVTVRRQLQSGDIAEFTAREIWIENYAEKGGKEKSIAPNAMWSKRPYGQLAKCAEAQALRKAFPEVGAQPTAEEMEGKSLGQDSAPAQAPAGRPEREAYPEADFTKNLPTWTGLIKAGKKSAGELIALIESKGALTDKQKTTIREAEVIDGEVVEEGERE